MPPIIPTPPPSVSAPSPPAKIRPGYDYECLTEDESDEEVKEKRRRAKQTGISDALNGCHTTRFRVRTVVEANKAVQSEGKPAGHADIYKPIEDAEKKIKRNGHGTSAKKKKHSLDNAPVNTPAKKKHSLDKAAVNTPAKKQKVPNGARSVSTPARALHDKTNVMAGGKPEQPKAKVNAEPQNSGNQAMEPPANAESPEPVDVDMSQLLQLTIDQKNQINFLSWSMESLIDRIDNLKIGEHDVGPVLKEGRFNLKNFEMLSKAYA